MTFDLLGRTVRVRGAGPALHTWLEGRFIFGQYAGVLQSDFTINLEAIDQPIPLHDQARRLIVADLPMYSLESSQGCCFWAETGGVLYQLESGSAQLQIWGTTPENLLSGPVLSALVAAMGEALIVSGLVSLHASVAARDGEALAFLGPSGRGKTTTLLRAMQAGWQPIAEDYSWLEPLSGNVFGFDRALRLLPDSLQLLQTWRPEVQPAYMHLGKGVVPFASLGFEPRATPLKGFALLKRDERHDSSWENISAKEAALALWQATGLPAAARAREELSKYLPLLLGYTWKQLVLGKGDVF